MKSKSYSLEIGGKTLTATFSDLAERAHGSVLISSGNTTVLVTAVMASEPRDSDFLPLTVDYEEKFYASGQILGSRFIRREGRPSDEAVISERIVDRTIRPLFDQWIRQEIQIIVSVLSIDQEDPDTLAVIGTSLALSTSPIPFNGPVSAVRVLKLKPADALPGTAIINPPFATRDQKNLVEFELLACGKDNQINMIELAGNETSEASVTRALQIASVEIEKIQQFQKKIIAEIRKPKIVIEQPRVSRSLQDLFSKEIAPKLDSYIFSEKSSGYFGDGKIEKLREIWLKLASEKSLEDLATMGKNQVKARANELLEMEISALIHQEAIQKKRRADGRSMKEIRPLYAQAGGLSPNLHGLGIFYRGQTHILSALTLGGPKDGQLIENIESPQHEKHFFHHYNFPPFSTGETGRVGGLSRRAIGHGALAEKALAPMIPSKNFFPYTIRIVSEALSSNGSTSMASVCASTLALMDGGVPITRPVAGISCGLMLDQKNSSKYTILTDIQGPEDHYGDMDFKVAGTRQGINAIQMDIKISSVPINILAEALEQARLARFKILDVIEQTIAKPRDQISAHAPKIITLKARPEKIGLIIGPGGKTINGIKASTGVQSIDVEEDGTIYIVGKNGSAEKAQEKLRLLI